MAKKALCIGINNYPGSGLRGCVNDASDWAEALIARSFEVITLIDAQAGKNAIISAMSLLISGAAKGDSVVITYAGHGTLLPYGEDEDSTSFSSALCPWDCASGEVLHYKEIASIFMLRTTGVRILMFPDSCHSATVVGGNYNFDIGMALPRYMPPSELMLQDALLPTRCRHQPSRDGRSAIISGPSCSGADLLMAGCLENEFSFDSNFNGRPNGAFTHFALKSLPLLPAHATYEDWLRAIRRTLPARKLPQSPQLLGSPKARAWEVFS